MIQINLNENSKTYLETIKNNKNQKIILYDLLDPVRIYPADKTVRKNDYHNWLYEIFTKIEPEYYKNLHFLTCDFNIYYTYHKVKSACILYELISEDYDDFHVHLYPWVFAKTMSSIHYDLNEKLLNNIKFKYNVNFLSLGRKLARIMLIRRFYENKKFVYSNLGYNAIITEPNFDESTIWDKFEIVNITPIDDWNFKVNLRDRYFNYAVEYYNADTVMHNCYFKEKNFYSHAKKELTEDYLFYKNKNFILNELKFRKVEFQYFSPLEYFESATSLICETSVSISTFFSEKTFKDIFAKKPSLAMAGPNYYNFLENEGFLLLDDLYDYSFDKLRNYHDRFNLLTNEIQKILDYKLEDLIDIVRSEKMKHKLEHNRECGLSKISDYDKLFFGQVKGLKKHMMNCIIDNDERFMARKHA